MSVLKQVLEVFQETRQPLSIPQIARQLGIETALVEEMIAFWVRKGKLRDVSACTDNCQTCSSRAGGCPFIVQIPRRYEWVTTPPVHRQSD